MVVKEAKASAATVKLGEKQIDSITEKMEAFRNENVKFKAFVKERLYGVEVINNIIIIFRGVSMTRN